MAINELSKWKTSAQKLKQANNNGDKVLTTFLGLLTFLHQFDWQGACHASSAVFATLLGHQGLEVTVCLGEVSYGKIYFDHSWIEVDGKIYDVAISNTLIEGFAFPPVFCNTDLSTRKPTELMYGNPSGQGYDASASWIRNTSIAEYMGMFQGHPHGLFGIAHVVGRSIGLKLSVDEIRKQAHKLVWTERPQSAAADNDSSVGQ